jgi:hypothetical protein
MLIAKRRGTGSVKTAAGDGWVLAFGKMMQM